MSTLRIASPIFAAMLAWSGIGVAVAQGVDVLKGTWVRPDGDYSIVIKSIAASGEIDASYFNPNPLPFGRAQASRDGTTVRAFFELRAGGYNGSTYTLTYEPASDRLQGTYYQAVAKQSYNVYFLRK